jgi:hypothetical protein
MTLNKDNPKEAPAKKAKKPEYPAWPGIEAAELGVQYINAKGNIIQRGRTNG